MVSLELKLNAKKWESKLYTRCATKSMLARGVQRLDILYIVRVDNIGALIRKSGLSKAISILIAAAITILSIVGLYVQTGYVRISTVGWGSTTTSDSIQFQIPRILDEIQVSSSPSSVAYDQDNGMLYVSRSGGTAAAIDVISDTNHSISSTINLPGNDPSFLLFDSNYSHLYAYDRSSGDYIYVINPDTNQITGNISTGVDGLIGDAVYDPANQDIYLAGGSSNSLIVISTETNSVFQTVSIKGNPSFVAYDQSNGYIYVAGRGSESHPSAITIISPLALIPAIANDVVLTLKLPANIGGICYVPDTQNVYVLTNSPAAISAISGQTNKPISTIFLPSTLSLGSASDIVYDQPNQLLLISTGNNSLVEFNPSANTLERILAIPPLSNILSVNPVNGNFYTSYSQNEIFEVAP